MKLKVFVPMSDDVLGDNGEVCQYLIPFDPSFLPERESPGDGHKPSNWITDCDYEQARQRLFATQV